MSVTYRLATPADGPAAAAMGRRCFVETFGAHFPADDMAAHLDRMFGPGGLPAELDDPTVRVMLAEEDNAIAGYLKLVPASLEIEHPPGALEIKQLYVLEPWQGAGVAPALIDWAIATARGEAAPALFLSVWSEGARAIAFYRRQGFVTVGHAPFLLGSRTYSDPVMRLEL
ncbi:MAG TPA: GNAT family N-acetyltransferase [Allosphingosinicella sp.]|nr:GNAT family N-acetyltransferase [Allosphingosinicella sp.]